MHARNKLSAGLPCTFKIGKLVVGDALPNVMTVDNSKASKLELLTCPHQTSWLLHFRGGAPRVRGWDEVAPRGELSEVSDVSRRCYERRKVPSGPFITHQSSLTSWQVSLAP